MNLKNMEKEKRLALYFKIFATFIILISVALIIISVLDFFFYLTEDIEIHKDADYFLRLNELKDGLLNVYDPTGKRFAPIYLFHGFLIFYPFTFIPPIIGLFIWDALRIIAFLYVGKRVTEFTKNERILLIFYFLNLLGYFFDLYFNNSNFLILIFLFFSYKYLREGKMWLMGIFFALASYKFNVLLYPFILLLIKEIKLKDLKYIIIPFGVILLPYALYPPFAIQLFENMFVLEDNVGQIIHINTGNMVLDFIFKIGMFSWQAFQLPHFVYYSLFILIILVRYHDKDYKIREKARKSEKITDEDIMNHK